MGRLKRLASSYQEVCRVWRNENASTSQEASCSTLTPHLDLKTISKFAQLEYKLGDPERGKTIFEGIVESHSKRWDLWSIYIDMQAGQNDIASLRFDVLPICHC